jgi:hypothetical protein
MSCVEEKSHLVIGLLWTNVFHVPGSALGLGWGTSGEIRHELDPESVAVVLHRLSEGNSGVGKYADRRVVQMLNSRFQAGASKSFVVVC